MGKANKYLSIFFFSFLSSLGPSLNEVFYFHLLITDFDGPL